ncbi:MAG TPA: TIGR02757 family protein [Candidatus Manganitrophaceae bacterium]|nr:TIGR02757 family protein [Candidatus Manganitrophaceae bacterium]
MTRRQRNRLAPLLEDFYRKQPLRHRIREDPVELPRRYADPREIEAVALLSSTLAYGRVPLFKAVVEKILALAGGSPYRYLTSFDPAREAPRFQGIYYRLNATEDLFALIYLMSRAVRQYGSIGALFLSLYREEEADLGPTLSRFVETILSFDTRPVYGKSFVPNGLRQLLSSPASGSACKRLNLFLRWMVRPDDGIDFGLWKEIPPGKLTIPLDTHIIRISRYLGLTARKSPDWKMAREITDSLRMLDPADPLKYDFLLCHLGISGACPIEKSREKCADCPLLPACRRGLRLVR